MPCALTAAVMQPCSAILRSLAKTTTTFSATTATRQRWMSSGTSIKPYRAGEFHYKITNYDYNGTTLYFKNITIVYNGVSSTLDTEINY